MIASMTGFAAATREVPGGQLALEIKSVNHRYLEVQARMGDDLRPLEPLLREALAASLTRGKVDCRLTFTASAGEARALEPDQAALRALATASARVQSVFPDARPLSVSEVLHWPGVLAGSALADDDAREAVAALAAAAVADLAATRRREGEKLSAVLRDRLKAISALVLRARPHVPAAIVAFRDKLAARIAEAGGALGDERLQQEVVLFASRIDVAEELDRLEAHVAEFTRVLDKGGACGKRLDFLCQEFNREANTLGSKAASAEVTGLAVELKVLIEQMREQVQNVE